MRPTNKPYNNKYKIHDRRLAVRMPKTLYENFEILANEKGVSQSFLFRQAVAQYLENQRSVAA